MTLNIFCSPFTHDSKTVFTFFLPLNLLSGQFDPTTLYIFYFSDLTNSEHALVFDLKAVEKEIQDLETKLKLMWISDGM